MSSRKQDRMKPIVACVQRKLGTTEGKGNALYPIVCAAIPENLRASIVFTRLKNRRLHLVVSNGAAASRLRFCHRALLEACAVLPEGPEHISIRVAPEGTVREAPAPTLRSGRDHKAQMGESAAVGLREAADGVEHKRLSEALKRLASRAEQARPK